MDQPNIILVVFDTLRRDVLPMYGGRADTPNLNEFAKDSVIFPNAISPSPWTYPSHISLITGLYPFEHEGHEYFNETKNEFDLNIHYKGKTVTEKLYEKGYNTIGLTANGVIGPESGFDKGFNYFEHIPPDALYTYELKKVKEIFPDGNINLKKIYKFNEMLKLYGLYKKMNSYKKYNLWPKLKGANIIVQRFFEISINKPFFLFLNFVEPHEPYVKWELTRFKYPFYKQMLFVEDLADKKIPDKIINDIREKYVDNLNLLDFYFGELIKYLKKIKEYENSMIIITSDHGQALKEKNYYTHGLFLYDQIIEIPLIVKFPNNKKIIISEHGYQSITHLNKLILNAVDGNILDITEEKVFSESYGFHVPLFKVIKDKNKALEMKNRYGNPRKAVYKNGFKLVINGNNGEIEEFTLKGKDISPQDHKEVLDDLLNELEIFKGTQRFVVENN